MKFPIPLAMILLAMNFACSSPGMTTEAAEMPRTSPEIYYGNIYGTITDGSNGAPVKNALIYVTQKPVRYLSQMDPGTVLSDQGPVLLPEGASIIGQTFTKDDGTFIVNHIPVTGSSQRYTVLIEAEGRDTIVLDQVLVLPGAAMALRIDCRMTSDGKVRIIKVLNGHENVDINYNDQLQAPVKR